MKLGNASLKQQQAGEAPPSRVWGRAGHAPETKDMVHIAEGVGGSYGMERESDVIEGAGGAWHIAQRGLWKALVRFGRTRTRGRCEDRMRKVSRV